MKNSVIRLKPCENWYIGELESWLSGMSRQGLYLTKFGISFARFAKGEPKQMRVRILLQNGFITNQIAMFAKQGWSYVTSDSSKEIHIFASPDEGGALEIPADSSEQSANLKEKAKTLMNKAKIQAIITFFMTFMCVLFLSIGETPYLNLFKAINMILFLFPFLYVYQTIYFFNGSLSVRKREKAVYEQKMQYSPAPWRKKYIATLIKLGISIALLIAFTVYTICLFTLFGRRPLPDDSSSLPIVRLSDIEQDPALERVTGYSDDGSWDYENNIYYEWSLFAPLQYETREHGTIASIPAKSGSGGYSPSMETTVYKLTFPFIKEKVLSEMIAKQSLSYKGSDSVKIENQNFDKLILREINGYREIWAAKGKGIIFVRYIGNAETDTIIEAVHEKMVMISG